LRLVLWSAWGREWDEPDAAHVARRVIAALAPGAIVLLHDADVDSPPGSSRRGADALGIIAEAIAARSMTTATLDELIAT
jgi:peptidoglycan/xylan/chitin deacetylase (PgdA/CDA1 family)